MNEVSLMVLGIDKLCGDGEMRFLYPLLSKVLIIKLWVVALSGEDESC